MKGCLGELLPFMLTEPIVQLINRHLASRTITGKQNMMLTKGRRATAFPTGEHLNCYPTLSSSVCCPTAHLGGVEGEEGYHQFPVCIQHACQPTDAEYVDEDGQPPDHTHGAP